MTVDLGNSVRMLAGLIGLAAVTCLCAYLLIYNIMHLSVAGKVRYYGTASDSRNDGKTDKTNVKEADAVDRIHWNYAGMSAGDICVHFP